MKVKYLTKAIILHIILSLTMCVIKVPLEYLIDNIKKTKTKSKIVQKYKLFRNHVHMYIFCPKPHKQIICLFTLTIIVADIDVTFESDFYLGFLN